MAIMKIIIVNSYIYEVKKLVCNTVLVILNQVIQIFNSILNVLTSTNQNQTTIPLV